MTEELTLEEGFGDGPAIDNNHRFFRPGARAMDQSCEELLAGSALSLYQDRCTARRNPSGHVNDRFHPGIFIDDLPRGYLFLPEFLSEDLVFPNEGLPLRDPVHKNNQFIQIDRLRDIVHGSELHGVHSRFYRAVCRHHDDVDLGIDFFYLLQDLDPVHPRHLEIEEEEIEMVFPHLTNSGITVFCTDNPMSFSGKKFLQHLPLGLSIFNNQYVQRLHYATPSFSTGKGEQDHKGCSHAVLAFNLNLSPVTPNDLVCQGQAESQPLFLCRIFRIEYMIDLVGSQTTSGILYLDAYHPLPLRRSGDDDRSLSCNGLHRVLQKIVEGLPELVHIHRDNQGIIALPIGLYRNSLQIGLFAYQAGHSFQNHSNGMIAELKPTAAGKNNEFFHDPV